jgi:GNAT superfamily N-acetyltransferase
MTIRPATEADIVKASRLWLEMLAEMAPQYKTPNVGWWRGIATTNMRQENYFLLVADEGGKIVGFVDYFLFPEPSTGQIHAVGQHLFLRPEYRGKGMGRELLKTAEAQAIAKGVKAIDMFCFDAEKPMWEKHGYRPLRSLLRREVQSV